MGWWPWCCCDELGPYTTQVFDSSLVELWRYNHGNTVWNVAELSDGRLVTYGSAESTSGNSYRVRIHTQADGTVEASWAVSGNGNGIGLAVDSSDNIYCGTGENGVADPIIVRKFNTSGTQTATFTHGGVTSGSNPSTFDATANFVSVDSSGNVYVCGSNSSLTDGGSAVTQFYHQYASGGTRNFRRAEGTGYIFGAAPTDSTYAVYGWSRANQTSCSVYNAPGMTFVRQLNNTYTDANPRPVRGGSMSTDDRIAISGQSGFVAWNDGRGTPFQFALPNAYGVRFDSTNRIWVAGRSTGDPTARYSTTGVLGSTISRESASRDVQELASGRITVVGLVATPV